MIPSVLGAIFLAFPKAAESPRIDLRDPKQRAAFAARHKARLKIPLDAENAVLKECQVPFARFSAEHAQILFCLMDAHMATLKSRREKLAYVVSWRTNHSRLSENSVIGTICAVCVGFGLDTIFSLLRDRLTPSQGAIFLFACIFEISCLAYVWKDARLTRRFYELLIDNVEAEIEKTP